MIAIGIILNVLVFFILSGLVSIDKKLEVMINRQDEIIRTIKNSK